MRDVREYFEEYTEQGIDAHTAMKLAMEDREDQDDRRYDMRPDRGAKRK